MKKHLKYLLSLLLVFGLTVNDGILYSQSNSAEYYQFSNVIFSSETTTKGSKVYLFNQVSPQKTSFPVLLTFLEFKAINTLQIRVIQKIQTLLYQKIRSITSQYIFVNEIIFSKNSSESLYIA